MAQYYYGFKEKIKNDIVKNNRLKDFEIIIEKVIRIDNRMYKRRLEKKGDYLQIKSRFKEKQKGY